MAGRFPGAANTSEFWRNLAGGVESISFFSSEELLAESVTADLIADPAYVRARGVIRDAEWFDASFFGFAPRQAEVMDPQHRLFMECAWEVLESAGYDPQRYPGAIGVYAGASMNLKGPSITVQTSLLHVTGGRPSRLSKSSERRVRHGARRGRVDRLPAEGWIRVPRRWNTFAGTVIAGRSTRRPLADRFGVSLRGLIDHCLTSEAGGASPSDFPLADLDQETLDRLLEGQQHS